MIIERDEGDDGALWPWLAGAGLAIAGVVVLWPRRAEAVTTPRYSRGVTGTAFADSLRGMSLAERERAIVEAVAAGATPEAFDNYVAVEVSGGGHRGVFWAAPWHLAVGTDADAFHAPLTATSAQRAADALGQALPTRKMAEAIHRSPAFRRLPFRAFPPEAGHRSLETYAASSEAIERDRGGSPGPVQGYAKDYVVTPQRRGRESRIAIYGGWDANGRLIQQVEGLPHDLGHVDYSQKPRLVASVVWVDGVEMPLADALASPEYAAVFSDEGPIEPALQRYPT